MHDAEDDPRKLLQLSSKAEVSRREALQWMAMGVLAASTGCLKEPGDTVLPYVEVPPGMTPGTPQVYATSMVTDGYATGLLVSTREGRPIKIDGNPLHPASLGASTPQQQAAVLDVYDPHRLKSVLYQGEPSSWGRLESQLTVPSAGSLWLVMPRQSSPVVASLLERIRTKHREVHVVYADLPAQRHTQRGASLVYGRSLEQQLDLAQADVIVCLDADPFSSMPMSLKWARDFALRRRPTSPEAVMNRLYAAEPMLSPTGTLSDDRVALPASHMTALACGIALALAQAGRTLPLLPWQSMHTLAARLDDTGRQWAKRAALDLSQHAGKSVVVVGERQPPACHALAHLLNAALGNTGRTVSLIESPLLSSDNEHTLSGLADALRAGQVDRVVILDSNPVYASPRGAELGMLLARARLSVHYSRYANETSGACTFAVPASHFLESWGDARAADGTFSCIQPVVRPLYGTRSAIELLATLSGLPRAEIEGRTLVRAQLRRTLGADAAFEEAWGHTLRTGLLAGSAFSVWSGQPSPTAQLSTELDALAALRDTPLELALSRSSHVQGGDMANNGWLQELPHPITKQTWGNALLMGPATASRLGIRDEHLVRIRVGPHALELPALVLPHHAERCVTVELGYGRRSRNEALAYGVGGSGFSLMADERSLVQRDVHLEVTGRTQQVARTQSDFDQHGRGIALSRTLAQHRKSQENAHEQLPSMLPDLPKMGLQWAMTIDMTLCTGCSSCVVACQAENNIPVVGAEGVRRGREMHWLRIDTYYANAERTRVVNQPMLCQHCEHAPCEYVCPVFATEHSPDGLNEMVYNRCIGTRFCSNNCPYKVRRFNWFNYTRDDGTLSLQRNPEVTVRERGVMEKCTYCVQRIRAAEIAARMERRAIRPGEVTTACQDACPTTAIQFGALEHADTLMVRLRSDPRCYEVLGEVGTRPRTQYLASIVNSPANEGAP